MDLFKNWLKKNSPSLLILAVLVFITYLNSFFNNFVSDDISILQQNPNLPFSYFLNPPLRIARNIFIFLAYKAGYNNPFYYHMINIFFHIGMVWVSFILLSLMVNSTIAFLAAMIFSVHPILTESVAWISGGVYVQYAFFLISSLIFYIVNKKNSKFYFISIVFFLLAIFTAADKAIIYPLLLFVYELSFGDLKKNWKSLIPFFLISFVTVFIYWQSGDIGQRIQSVQTNFYQKNTIYNPLIQIPIAITSYLQLLFWPDKLAFYHSEMSFSQVEYVIRLMGFIGLIGIIGYSWLKNKLIFFWLSFFIISLLPTLTPFGISWIVAERYVYLGSVGIIFIASYGLSALINNKEIEGIGYLIFIIIIISLMTLTIIRNFDWKNQDTLWLATAKTSPSSSQNHNNLGDLYGRWGDLKRSAEEFKIALKIDPSYADVYNNLGNTYLQMGSRSAALENYQLALKYNPNLWQSYQNIGVIYLEQGKLASAEAEMQKAIKVFPNNPQLHVNLGVIYLKMNEKNKAKEAFYQALAIDPKNERAKLGLIEVNK